MLSCLTLLIATLQASPAKTLSLITINFIDMTAAGKTSTNYYPTLCVKRPSRNSDVERVASKKSGRYIDGGGG